MSLATNASVRLTLGFDLPDSYRLFQLADDATLTAYINGKIVVASAWLSARLDGDYPPADSDKLAAVTEAEIYLTGSYLVERLKTLKATGTHFAYLSEDSEQLHSLIENNYHERVRDLLVPYIQTDSATTPIVLPSFGVGTGVNTDTSDTWQVELQDLIDETKALVGRQ